MSERLNLVDRYDLACLRDEINRDNNKLHNNEICPIKKSLQLHREQINGLGEIITFMANEIDKNKEKSNEDLKKSNLLKIKIDRLLLKKYNRLNDLISYLTKSFENYTVKNDNIVNKNHMNILEKIKYNDDLYYQVKQQIKYNVYIFNLFLISIIIINVLYFIF